MPKLKFLINKIIRIGVLDNHTKKESGKISLVNIISFIGVIVCVIYITIGQIYSTGFVYYEILFALLFISPVILNYLNKNEYAKSVLVFTIISAVYIGTYLVGYERDFKFAIIIPIALLIMFFQKKHSWSLYLIIFIFTIGNEYVYYNNLQITTDFEEANYIYKLITFLMVLVGFITIQLLFTKHIRDAETNLFHRIKYEKIVSEFSKTILTNDPGAIDKGLQGILELSKVSRIYIFENFEDPVDGLCAKQTHELCAPGVKPEFDNQILQKVPYLKYGYSRWVEQFEKNKIVCGVVNDFPGSEKKLLQAQGIKSILSIPIYENSKWNGFIGFDDVDEERIWEKEDIGLLTTVAGTIGLHKEKTHQYQIISQRNEELSALNATKNKFFSIIAHDLKSPFNGIIGLSEVLLESINNCDYKNAEELSIMINKASNDAFNLLENLLLWAQTQTGTIGFNPEKINISAAIIENIEFVRIMALGKQISITNQSGNEIECFADQYMINTIFRNLLINAIKFTNVGGVIDVGWSKERNDVVKIFIQDDGIGMSSEKMRDLFSINKSYSTKGTSEETGTGLGLHICKEFIEKHKGNIWVESEVGKGSKFYFSLPIKNN